MKNGFFISVILFFSASAWALPPVCNSRDEDLIQEVEDQLTYKSGDAALKSLQKLSKACQKDPEIQLYFAKAYAAVGDIFISNVLYLTYATDESVYQRLFGLFFKPKPAYGRKAIDTILAIAPEHSQRTNDENLALGALAAGYFGAMLTGADLNEDRFINEDDVNFCESTQVDDAIIKEFLYANGFILQNANQFVDGGDILGEYANQLSKLCSDQKIHLCDVRQIVDITPDDIKWMRKLLVSKNYGVGTCSEDAEKCCP